MFRSPSRLGWSLRLLLVSGGLLASLGNSRAGDTAVVEGRVALPVRSAEGPAAFSGRYSLGGGPAVSAPVPPEAPGAVVYLEGRFPTVANPHHEAAVMGQRNARFIPGVLPVMVGTTVEFPNLDDFYHNVFSYSKPKRFDLGRYRKDERAATQTFDKPGVVTLHCEIHEAMRGTILVLETPFFVKTDRDGHFRLTGLPAGKYLLKAWVDERTTREQTVELKEGGVSHVDFP